MSDDFISDLLSSVQPDSIWFLLINWSALIALAILVAFGYSGIKWVINDMAYQPDSDQLKAAKLWDKRGDY